MGPGDLQMYTHIHVCIDMYIVEVYISLKSTGDGKSPGSCRFTYIYTYTCIFVNINMYIYIFEVYI